MLIAGRETLLDEEYTEQEVEAELAPVNVQLAYTLAGLGQTAEAAASYEVSSLYRTESERLHTPLQRSRTCAVQMRLRLPGLPSRKCWRQESRTSLPWL